MTAPEDSGPDSDDLMLCDDDDYISIQSSSESIAASPRPPSPVIKTEDDGDVPPMAVDDLPQGGDQNEPAPNQHAIDKIEEWALQILEEITSGNPTFLFETVSCRKKSTQDNASRRRRIIWPSKRTPTLKTIAGMAKVAELSHLALKDDVPTTKRDIFYHDVGLFGKQSVVDALVDDLAATLDLRRADLNVRASLKGLFCGSTLTLTTKQGEVIRGLDCEETLIPVGEDIININVEEELQWVLVVEKEAVFQTLCQLGFTARYEDIGPGIMVTGKGYPDLATRQLVSIFSEELSTDIPILGLVDADSHGLDILSTYKFGSRTMTHENELLVAPRIEWIGVKRSDMEELGVSKSKMLKITSADIRKAESMLRDTNPVILPQEWITELETMLETRTKAEIEIISGPRGPQTGAGSSAPKGAHALAQYVHGKILSALNVIRDQTESEDSSDMVDFDESTNLEFPEASHSWSLPSVSTEPELETPETSQQYELGSCPRIKQEPLDVIDLDFEDDF